MSKQDISLRCEGDSCDICKIIYPADLCLRCFDRFIDYPFCNLFCKKCDQEFYKDLKIKVLKEKIKKLIKSNE